MKRETGTGQLTFSRTSGSVPRRRSSDPSRPVVAQRDPMPWHENAPAGPFHHARGGHGPAIKRASSPVYRERKRSAMHQGVPHGDESDCHHQGMKRGRSREEQQRDVEERAGEQYPYAAGAWTSAPWSAAAPAPTRPVQSLRVPQSAVPAQAGQPAPEVQAWMSSLVAGGASQLEAMGTAAASAPLAAPTAVATSSLANPSEYFYGASSYYIHALTDSDRHAVLDALVAGGFSTVRIFIASVYAGNKVRFVAPQSIFSLILYSMRW